MPGGVSSGTGFLLDIGDEDVYFVPVLMTNKHVIQGASQFGTLRRPPGDTDLPDFGKRLDFGAGPEDPLHRHPDITAAPMLPMLGERAREVFVSSVFHGLAAISWLTNRRQQRCSTTNMRIRKEHLGQHEPTLVDVSLALIDHSLTRLPSWRPPGPKQGNARLECSNWWARVGRARLEQDPVK